MVEQSTRKTIYLATAAFTAFVLYNLGLAHFVAKKTIFINGIAIARASKIQRARINTARSLFREEPNVLEPDYFIFLGSKSISAYYVPFSNSIGLSEYILDSLSEWDLAAIMAHEMAHAESFELMISPPKTLGKTIYDSTPVLPKPPAKEDLTLRRKPHYFFDIRAAELTSKEAVLVMLQKTHLNTERFYRKNRFWFFLYGSLEVVKRDSFVKTINEFLERIERVRNADI